MHVRTRTHTPSFAMNIEHAIVQVVLLLIVPPPSPLLSSNEINPKEGLCICCICTL
jgi:hypothetical protein